MELAAKEAYRIKMTIKSLEKQYNFLMDKLKASGQTRFGQYNLTMTTRPGPIDYNSIPLLQSINLEQFRKPSIDVYKLEYLGEEL